MPGPVTLLGSFGQRGAQQIEGECRYAQEAEQNAEADRRRRGFAELRNKADGLIYSTERTLEEYAEHISPEDRDALAARRNRASHTSPAD